MATYTTTVESIMNSVIQDGQVMTTNRTAILDYIDRVSQRILRESKWLFLRSEEQQFVTMPDVANYWIGSGPPPQGALDTQLQLPDVFAILNNTVFDLTNRRRLQPDAVGTLGNSIHRYPDGTFQASNPRSYRWDYNNPGLITLTPPPDAQIQYQPIPNSPVCQLIQQGSIATSRTYWVEVTFVDSQGGESLPCKTPTQITVPAGYLLTVQTPVLPVTAGNDVSYGYYNVYLATSISGTYYLQNSNPVQSPNVWTEPLSGANHLLFPAQSVLLKSPSGYVYSLTVTTNGLLQTTSYTYVGPVPNVYAYDSNNNPWLLTVTDGGLLGAQLIPGISPSGLQLADTTSQVWQITVNGIGLPIATSTTNGPVATYPPTISTIQPLIGYVISFYYQKKRLPITSTTQILQIPDDYVDVLIAGVNYYTNLYTAKADDLGAKAGIWKKEFMDGMAQIRRDLRQNFADTDFVSPDAVSQAWQTLPLGYPVFM